MRLLTALGQDVKITIGVKLPLVGRFRRCRCVHQETFWEITGRSHQRVLMPYRVGVATS